MIRGMPSERQVTSGDGVRIAVYEQGDQHCPLVICVHGFPDNHAVWDGVVAQLAPRYRVVTYDVRGAGASDKPTDRAAYRLDRLELDFTAVLDAVGPRRPAHLIAHDWGSIQSWHFVTSDDLRGRIASFTSISGPDLDHAGHWFRSRVRPNPRALGQLARQLGSSYYIVLFQLPVLPERILASNFAERMLASSAAVGRSARAVETNDTWSKTDRTIGIQLYRANMLGRRGAPARRTTDIPVQVIAPTADIFVGAALQHAAPRPFASDLRTRTISGGHWVVSARPDVVARCAAELIDHVEGGPEPAALARARAPKTHRPFAGQLAVITGAGAGIGRETALELARQGADIVAADVDEVSAERTADLLRPLGVQASPYYLDVSDADEWERFAAQVQAAHGVPDIVVNNAGIGMAGGLLDTSRADWERIVGVNFWGVLHGSRLFAAQMVGRGSGGHIVNIASAAAYSPSRLTVAYSTTKAAVLMLSESMAVDLAREGIKVTVVCPGFVNTGIAASTTYVGRDAEAQRRLREHAAKSYRRRNYSPERTARQIVTAIRRGKGVVTVTPEAKLLLALDRFAPALQRALGRIDLSRL
jgi:NAD(P)-dependent dehydrogenase (short-subunit alcohol dehydrogenase family)/pimeloyl-ACP methyl ester carboxylesterase